MIQRPSYWMASMIVFLVQFTFFTPHALANPYGERPCVTTGYYSPLPDQDFYVTGSEYSDKVLNGQGIAAADGTPVYLGMAAVPKSIPFGSIIEIPEMNWVLMAHDRGGAIVDGEGYFRLDVWTGPGEEGLALALNLGKRSFDCIVHPAGTDMEVSVDLNDIPDSLPTHRIAQMQAKAAFALDGMVSGSDLTSSWQTVDDSTLQEALKQLGYYQKEITGRFDEVTREALVAFQVDRALIDGVTSYGAGYFGPKTKRALLQALSSQEVASSQDLTSDSDPSESSNGRSKAQERLHKNMDDLTPGLRQGDRNESVRRLNQVLWELGYYRHPLSDEYSDVTSDAVRRFQLDFEVILNEYDSGAGQYGPKTDEAMRRVMQKRIERLTRYPLEKRMWFPAKRPLPSLSQLSLPSQDLEQGFVYDLRFDLIASVEPIEEIQIVKQGPVFLSVEMDLNDSGDQVVLLQQHLIDLGYLNEDLDTGYYGPQTKEAVLRYQLDQGIVSTFFDQGAGRVGPKTKQFLNDFIGT